MRVSITIDDEGEDVSVSNNREESATEPADEPTELDSIPGKHLSAGRASAGDTGYNPEDLPTVSFGPEGHEETTDAPTGTGTAATGGPMATPVDQGTPPVSGRTYPLTPSRGGVHPSDIYLGNEY
jgi:hypothetical protein